MLRIGCLEKWSSEELTEFVRLMIALLIRASRMDSCVTTLQISAEQRVFHIIQASPREVRMEGSRRRCRGRYGGVYDLSSKQVGTHSSHKIDVVLGHFWVRVGKHVDRLHHRFTKGTVDK
jgi:hypothetical protein